jgi:hypothetical protein
MCKCWRWRQRRRQRQADAEPLKVPAVITIPDYDRSRSTSKKKAYEALGDFLRQREYIWQFSTASPLFTLEEEGDLRELLLHMRRDDRSEVYKLQPTPALQTLLRIPGKLL